MATAASPEPRTTGQCPSPASSARRRSINRCQELRHVIFGVPLWRSQKWREINRGGVHRSAIERAGGQRGVLGVVAGTDWGAKLGRDFLGTDRFVKSQSVFSDEPPPEPIETLCPAMMPPPLRSTKCSTHVLYETKQYFLQPFLQPFARIHLPPRQGTLAALGRARWPRLGYLAPSRARIQRPLESSGACHRPRPAPRMSRLLRLHRPKPRTDFLGPHLSASSVGSF